MLRICVALCLGALLLLEPAAASADESKDDQIIKNVREDRGIGEVLLFYVPNRVFDAVDLLRIRGRVGPGVAVRARATEGVDVGIGSYASIYAGLPGPRNAVEVPLPIGAETYSGIELGPGDAEVDGGYSPDYSPTEIGASVHVLLAGIDIGVDPIEALDLLTGFLLIDLRGDDF
jgi:hypothetical protein